MLNCNESMVSFELTTASNSDFDEYTLEGFYEKFGIHVDVLHAFLFSVSSYAEPKIIVIYNDKDNPYPKVCEGSFSYDHIEKYLYVQITGDIAIEYHYDPEGSREVYLTR